MVDVQTLQNKYEKNWSYCPFIASSWCILRYWEIVWFKWFLNLVSFVWN